MFCQNKYYFLIIKTEKVAFGLNEAKGGLNSKK